MMSHPVSPTINGLNLSKNSMDPWDHRDRIVRPTAIIVDPIINRPDQPSEFLNSSLRTEITNFQIDKNGKLNPIMAQIYPPQVVRSVQGPPCLPLNQDVYVLKSLLEQVESILQSSDPAQSRNLLVNLHRNISTLIGSLGSIQLIPQAQESGPGPGSGSSSIPATVVQRSRELAIAAIFGDLPRIQALINAGTPNAPVALFNASAYGHLLVVQYLITMNGKPDFPIVDASLLVAAATGNLPIVQYLYPLSSRRPEVLNVSLYRAAANGQVDAVNFLLANGATDPSAISSAFIDAARNGYVNVVEYLVNQGVTNPTLIQQALQAAQSNPAAASVVAYLQSRFGLVTPPPSPPPSNTPSISGSSAGSSLTGSAESLGGSGSGTSSGSTSPSNLPTIQITPPSPSQQDGLDDPRAAGYRRFQQLRQARQFPRSRLER
jgi:hypothetical protein